MSLTSSLFKGDRALEACAVQDSAHVTPGAVGEHVAKIQFALSALDGLQIDRAELLKHQYGRSTAAAVLAYKKKRQIINRSYQSVPDDIVGKMTIAALDHEMHRRDLRLKPPGDCSSSPPGLITAASTAVSAVGRTQALAEGAGGRTTAPKQLGGFVPVFFQITQKASLEDGYPLAAHIDVARNLLFEHGISLNVLFGNGFVDTLPFNPRIIHSAGNPADNVDDIRLASENARPGVRGILRVIVCQIVGGKTGETFRNRSVAGRIVPPFVLLNSEEKDLDHATLIHEMIHASKDGPVPHDPERGSVFFEFARDKLGETNRSFLKAEHALTLSKLSSKL
jgi:hypothetical protein